LSRTDGAQGRQHEEQGDHERPDVGPDAERDRRDARQEPDTSRPAADPRKRESGGTSVARHPFVLPDVRDPGSDEEHREEHTPEQDDDPFGRGHDPSLANARPWRWSGVKPFTEELKPFTEEGDPPRWIPFFLTTTLVDRTS
jgi:hypothetical protein